jgi:agmatinase
MDTKPPMRYLLEPRLHPKHRFAYIGVPHDAATSLGNPGARYGPQALREALQGVFDWRLEDGRLADIDRGLLDLSAVEVADFGDVPLSYHDTERTVEETYQIVKEALESGYLPMIAGGDHGVTYPAVKALHDMCSGAVGLIQLDAHCDLLDYSDRQGRYSGSSGMRRSLELDRMAGPNLVQVGLRGYTTVEQYELGRRAGAQRITAAQFADMGADAVAERALHWAGEGTQAIYLTVDLDVITPGEAPGTGWPEPGGLSGQQVLDLVRLLAPHVAAIDVAELNPLFDSTSRATAILAARMLLDFICARL